MVMHGLSVRFIAMFRLRASLTATMILCISPTMNLAVMLPTLTAYLMMKLPLALTTAPLSLAKLMTDMLVALVVDLSEGLAVDTTWVLIAALALILMKTLLTLVSSHTFELMA